jgi:hypothetical protein
MGEEKPFHRNKRAALAVVLDRIVKFHSSSETADTNPTCRKNYGYEGYGKHTATIE